MTGQTRRHLFAAAALTAGWLANRAAKAAWTDDVRTEPRDWDRDDHKKHLHCFLRGTLIATPDGERPIETLVPGDEVRTWHREIMPIRWVGPYKWDRPHFESDLAPVRILASGIAPTIPRRDLWISQHHAIQVDGQLIEVGCLVNGRTIKRCPEIEDFEYFHIKLERHAIVIAEGLPCETLRGLGEAPCMPLTAYEYTRGAIKSHLRSALAPLADMRSSADKVRDQLWTTHWPA